jgi:outer membrane protein TolC
MSRRNCILPALLALLPVLPAGSAGAQDQAERPVLELSIDEAVERALQNNTDLAVERFRPESSAQDVRFAEGLFDPLLSSELSKGSSDSPQQSVFSGAETVNTKNWIWDFGVSQSVKTGGSWRATFNNNKTDTNNVFSTFNPSYGSTLTLGATQPLLRNFSIDSSRAQLRVAKNNRDISDVQFRQTVINTIANVKKAYYDIIAAIDNLDAQNKSLDLAKKLLNENQIKVKVGTLAPLDVVQAESEVASREEGVIVAEALLLQVEDTLKAAIFPKNDEELWALRIVPTARPTAEPREVDVQAAIATALEKRTDIVVSRKDLDNNDLSIRLARNQTLPSVDLFGTYGATGIGGTQIIRDGFGGPVLETLPGGYSDAVDQVFGRDFPRWSLGVNLSYPLFNRQARAAAARARITKDQALAALNRLEMQIVQEVRNAARDVESNFKRVESSRAARVLQERRLDAEEKKFAAGMSTNFFVTQAQRDLADASVAEIRAVLDYRKSLIEFDRVQEAGVGGGSGVILSSSVSSASTGAARSVVAGAAQVSQQNQ